MKNTRSTARDDVTRALCYRQNFAFPSRLCEKTEQGYIQALAQLFRKAGVKKVGKKQREESIYTTGSLAGSQTIK